MSVSPAEQRWMGPTQLTVGQIADEMAQAKKDHAPKPIKTFFARLHNLLRYNAELMMDPDTGKPNHPFF